MSILAMAAVAVMAVVLVAVTFQRRLIYFPRGDVPAPGDVGLGDAEDVTFVTDDGLTLGGWFVGVPAPVATVLVFNGNAGHRAYRAPLAARLRQRGVQVFLFDYRGYGDNPGTPTEAGLRADARAARAYVTSRSDVHAAQLVYFGESLGTAVAAGLAAEHEPAGVILRSPFVSLVEIGQRHYPWLPVGRLLRDRFAVADDVRRIRAPVLVIAGRRDRIVPLEQSRRLYDAVASPKEIVVLEAGHNDLALLAGDEMIAAIVRFLEALA